MTRHALLTLVILLAAAAPAAAADPLWSAPADIGPPADYVLSPGIAYANRGFGVLTWLQRAQPALAGGLPGAVSVVQDTPNDGVTSRALALGVPGATVQALPDSVVAGPVFQDSGRGLVLRTLSLSSDANGRRRQRVAWSAVGRDGRIGRVRTMTTATLEGAPALAEDHLGNAVAAWSELVAPRDGDAISERRRIRAAWRPAGGAFGRPVTLLTTDAPGYARNGQVEVAIGRAGRALVAYADLRIRRGRDRKQILVWSRTPRRAFGGATAVGPHSDAADIALAVNAHGRVFVAWGTQDGGEESNTPWILRAATQAPRGERFSTPQLLDRGTNDHRPQGGLKISLDGRGRATLAWSSVRDAGGFPVFAAAATDVSGRFGAPQQIAPMGAVGGLAVREDGAAIVTYARVVREQVTDQAYAAVRPARSTAFGAPEALGPVDHALPPVVAFKTSGGHPTAAWSARPGGVDPSNGIGTTAVLRVASRQSP